MLQSRLKRDVLRGFTNQLVAVALHAQVVQGALLSPPASILKAVAVADTTTR